MKSIYLLIPVMSVILIGCDNKPPAPKTDTSLTTDLNDEFSHTNTYAPDRTVREVRDHNSEAVTPRDQAESISDHKISKQIRRIIINDSNLSHNAKNIRIITIEGVVTLRGPVLNEKERHYIEELARSTPNVQRVNNLLEVR